MLTAILALIGGGCLWLATVTKGLDQKAEAVSQDWISKYTGKAVEDK